MNLKKNGLNILITGGGGFLGSALAKSLIKNNNSISLLVRKKTNLRRLGDLSYFNVGYCDTDEEISHFIADVRPDVIIHTACSYGRKGESMLQLIDSNIRFGSIILETILKLDKMIYFMNTSTVLPESINLYSITKHYFEKFGCYVNEIYNHNLQFINIKIHQIYGLDDDKTKFPTQIIDGCKNNIPTLSLTSCEQKRDFIFISDVIEAYEIILNNLHRIDKYKDVELGFGKSIRLKDFVETVHKLTDSKTKLLFGKIPYRKNEPMNLEANIEVMNSMGWYPKYSIEKGIKKMLELN